MRRKFLTTTLLSISLLSLTVSAATAGNETKCTGSHCMVDLSNLKPRTKRVASAAIVTPKVRSNPEGYSTVVIDNIETIVFDKNKYKMNDDELGEYELENSLALLTSPSSNDERLPNSDSFCEDNLKFVQVVGIENTYECA